MHFSEDNDNMIGHPTIRKWMNKKTGYGALLLSFFLLAYILPLGARSLVVPDETRYAEIPREMIAGGDWIVPHLNGLRYFEKPALGYWVHAGVLLLFGENNFSVRLPSALAVGLSALLIFALARLPARKRDGEDDFPAVLAALVFLSCFEVFGIGNTAVLDSLFSFLLTASITAFFFASEEQPGSGRERGFLLLAGLSCGLAFLTKGFLAFAVPVLALVPYLIWQRRYRDLLRMGWLPLLVAILTALPWSIAIHLREPDFWRFFFWNEHVRRFMAENAQHKESFWFFLLTAPGMFFPWIFMVPAAVPGVKTRLFGLILVAFLGVQFLGFNGLHPYGEPWRVMMVVNGLVFFILFCFWAFKSRMGKDKALTFGLAPLLLFLVAHFAIPDLTLESKAPGILLEQHKQEVIDKEIVIADEDSLSAACWYLGRSDLYVIGGAGELDYGLTYQDAAGRLLDLPAVRELIARNRGKAVLIARAKKISPWRDRLPATVFENQNGTSGYVIWRY